MENVQVWKVKVLMLAKGYGFLCRDGQPDMFFHCNNRKRFIVTRLGVSLGISDDAFQGLTDGQAVNVLEQQNGKAVAWIPRNECLLKLYCVIQVSEKTAQSEPVADNKRKVYTTKQETSITERVVFVGPLSFCDSYAKGRGDHKVIEVGVLQW